MSDESTRPALDALLAVGGGLLLIRQGIGRRGVLGAIDILLGVTALYRWLYASEPARQRLAAPPTASEPGNATGKTADKALVKPETLMNTPFHSE
jgi:hypothetical protein